MKLAGLLSLKFIQLGVGTKQTSNYKTR